MTKKIIVTANGVDRPGLVERVTGIIRRFEGNIEISRMDRLAGEFLMFFLVSIDEEKSDNLRQALNQSSDRELTISARYAVEPAAFQLDSYIPCELQVKGADHPGIINDMAVFLYQKGINIISMSSGVEPGAFSGVNIFFMTAQLMVPPDITLSELRERFSHIEKETNVEIRIEIAHR